MELAIEYVNIDEISPYEGNAKQHTEKQIKQIIKSIQQFGMNDPIAVWKDNEIIEGHGRLLACRELKMDEVPIIRLDHLTDEQRKAYCLAHNKITMNTGYDSDLLAAELEAITLIDMTDFGFKVDFDEAEEPDPDGNNFTYQIIIDCNDEDEMNTKMDKIEALGIKAFRKIV